MAFHTDYGFRTVFNPQTVSIISRLYKDLRILYSRDKRKLSNGQLWKILKENMLLKNYGPISLISWHLNQANDARGWGFCFVFSDPGAGVLH